MGDELDLAFCAFCDADRIPSSGRMLLVWEGTQQEIEGTRDVAFGACETCGRKFSGVSFGAHGETGKKGVFQFEHHDFHKVADQVDSFAIYLDSLRCQVCNVRIYEEGEPLHDIALRMLRSCPDAEHLLATCHDCSDRGRCPCCIEGDES